MKDEYTYKNYVKKNLIKQFEKQCKKNCLDFYSCGCILTAHLVMKDLMQHKEKDPICKKKINPKEAWEHSMKETPYHSGMSAAMTAVMIAKYSLRGDEFREWCIKDDVVMVKW